VLKHRATLFGAILGISLVTAVIIMGGAILWVSRVHDQRELEARKERVFLINKINLETCLDIETLKAAQRKEALTQFKQLDETLGLLRLKKTQVIINRAKSDRDRTLSLFAAEPCPREIIKN
jgi:hypothetical protein